MPSSGVKLISLAASVSWDWVRFDQIWIRTIRLWECWPGEFWHLQTKSGVCVSAPTDFDNSAAPR